MRKIVFSLLIGSTLFSACSKDSFIVPVEIAETCKIQTENPSGRSYDASAIVNYNCQDKHCGMLPLSTRNYWVYEDSIFNNGTFLRVQTDTLRFTSARKSLTDGLVWWNSNLFVGLPTSLYTNESAFFTLSDRMFTPDVLDARKEYIIPSGDSALYLTSFEDIAAAGRSVRLTEIVRTRAGDFSDVVYLEKHARYYRKDQVFFKPGLGVIKYIQEKAVPGDRTIKLQQISTLVAVHIE